MNSKFLKITLVTGMMLAAVLVSAPQASAYWGGGCGNLGWSNWGGCHNNCWGGWNRWPTFGGCGGWNRCW